MIEIVKSRLMRRFPLFDLTEESWSGYGDVNVTDGLEVYRNKSGDMIDCRSQGKRTGIIKAIARLQIAAEKSKDGHCCCSIGRSAVDGKWYGWSHRSMVGFGHGDKIFDADFNLCNACRGLTPGTDTVRELVQSTCVGGGPTPCDGSYTHHENDPCQGGACATRDSTLVIEHGDDDIVTDADARQAAINYASYVS